MTQHIVSRAAEFSTTCCAYRVWRCAERERRSVTWGFRISGEIRRGRHCCSIKILNFSNFRSITIFKN
ncbi:hypothetical protein F6G19_24240 [Salmonella enterica]|nr:hypothetical protein [Salmonella enterica]ECX4559007.1 hypothetical protein [Salmonella enterica]